MRFGEFVRQLRYAEPGSRPELSLEGESDSYKMLFYKGRLWLEKTMKRLVHKYGGTSLESIARIKNVADRVAKWRESVPEIVVVSLQWLGNK
ncbi:MAG: hypothetical protein CM15mP58_20580 [Burkholderiaceae bacterium]|nr:MAG: hypothetical protein CM15mP58_20580 [Burkholderiaceae bacterium]